MTHTLWSWTRQKECWRAHLSPDEDLRGVFFEHHKTILEGLSHPAVLSPAEVTSESGQVVLHFRPAPETSFEEVLPQLSREAIYEVLVQVWRALVYLHREGYTLHSLPFSEVVHQEEWKVLPLSLVPLGKPVYEPLHLHSDFKTPEAVEGAPLDGRTSLFLFGLWLYTLLTGIKPAFGGYLLGYDSLPPLDDLEPPEREAIYALLERMPSARPGSFQEALKLLLAIPLFRKAWEEKGKEVPPEASFPQARELFPDGRLLEEVSSLFFENLGLSCLWIQGCDLQTQPLSHKLAYLARLRGQKVAYLRGVESQAPFSSLGLNYRYFLDSQATPLHIFEKVLHHFRDQEVDVLLISHLHLADEATLRFLEYLLTIEADSPRVLGLFEDSGSPIFSAFWKRVREREEGHTIFLDSCPAGSEEKQVLEEAEQKLLCYLKSVGEPQKRSSLAEGLHLPDHMLATPLYRLWMRGLVHHTPLGWAPNTYRVYHPTYGDDLQDRPFSPLLEKPTELTLELLMRFGCWDGALNALEQVKSSQFSWKLVRQGSEVYELHGKHWEAANWLRTYPWEGLSQTEQLEYSLVLGKVLLRWRKYEESLLELERARELAKKLERPQELLETLVNLSSLYFETVKVKEAFELLEQGAFEPLLQGHDIPLWRHWILLKIAQGEYESAISKIQALESRPRVHLLDLATLSLLQARALLRQGEYRNIRQKIRSAREVYERLRAYEPLWESYLLEAQWLSEVYDRRAALVVARRAYAYALLLSEPRKLWSTLTVMGELEYELGERRQGTIHLLQAIYLANVAREPEALCELLLILGRVHLLRRDVGRAEVLMRKARELAKEKNLPYLSARVDFFSSRVAQLLGDEDLAEALRERALQTFRRLGNKKEFCEALLEKLKSQKQQGSSLDSHLLERFRHAVDHLGIDKLREQLEELD